MKAFQAHNQFTNFISIMLELIITVFIYLNYMLFSKLSSPHSRKLISSHKNKKEKIYSAKNINIRRELHV